MSTPKTAAEHPAPIAHTRSGVLGSRDFNQRKTLEVTIEVDPQRLASGTWCHQTDKCIGEGDIAAAYSGDRFGTTGRIRKPFKLNNQLYTNAGGCYSADHHYVKAYRLVTPALFDGTPVSYEERFSTMEKGAAARSDPNGALHGLRVTYRDKQFVLCGPPVILTPVPIPSNTPSKKPSTHRREEVAKPTTIETNAPPRTHGPATPRVKPTWPRVEQGLLFDL